MKDDEEGSKVSTREFKPTIQQEEIVEKSESGETFKAKARAGTGKTATAELVAEANSWTDIVYVVFNKSAQLDAAERMPGNTDSRTAHSLAYQAVIRNGPWKGRKLAKSAFEIVSIIEDDTRFLEDVVSITKGEHRAAAFCVVNTLVKWANTADTEAKLEHVPPAAISRFNSKADRAKAGNMIAKVARKLWERICEKKSPLPPTHDFYLKYWQLHEPKIDAELIMLDESQDLSPVMLDIVKQQGMQIVAFGDDQQQIYRWRGVENAMKALDGDILPLTKSFRFGTEIAGMANEFLILIGEEWMVEGAGQPGVVRDDFMDLTGQAVLCRGNAAVVNEALASMDMRFHTAICGGTMDATMLLYACWDLFQGKPVRHPEIGVFEDWMEFLDFSETEEGSQFKPIVRMIERYQRGIPALCQRLRYETVPEDDPKVQVTVSTVHKAKGREWNTVRLADDFPSLALVEETPEGKLQYKLNEDEANLGYVAVTRAKKDLNLAGYAEQLRADQLALGRLPGPVMQRLMKTKKGLVISVAKKAVKEELSLVECAVCEETVPRKNAARFRSTNEPGKEVTVCNRHKPDEWKPVIEQAFSLDPNRTLQPKSKGKKKVKEAKTKRFGNTDPSSYS